MFNINRSYHLIKEWETNKQAEVMMLAVLNIVKDWSKSDQQKKGEKCENQLVFLMQLDCGYLWILVFPFLSRLRSSASV